MHGAWVPSLVRELDPTFHMLQLKKKKKRFGYKFMAALFIISFKRLELAQISFNR